MKNRKAFITGISSTYLKKNEIDFLKTNKPWGVILFSRNINNFDQTKILINQIKSCFHDNNYPILIDEEGGRVSRLKNIIDTTLFAVSKDDLKPALTGVLFRFAQKNLIVVSTDGHRLVRYKEKDPGSIGFSGDIIAPRKFLSYLSTQLSAGDINISIGENYITTRMNQDTVITRTVGERFPDYESVIPKDNEKLLKADKESLLGAIRRVSIFSNRATHQVAMSLSSERCVVTTEDPETSSKAQEELPAEYNGDDLVIGYNAEYLQDVIKHIKGKTVFARFNTPISATLFNLEDNTEDNDGENLMLLMPIRLNG